MINAQNTQRANYLNEQYAQRNQPINEISSLLSGAQVTNPNFVSTQGQSVPTVDYAGLVNQNYQNQLAAYQQNQAGIGSPLGGVGSLFATGFATSDRNEKKDIKKVGGLHEYRMKGESKDAPKRIGVIAQEVEKICDLSRLREYALSCANAAWRPGHSYQAARPDVPRRQRR